MRTAILPRRKAELALVYTRVFVNQLLDSLTATGTSSDSHPTVGNFYRRTTTLTQDVI
jgi:hypothetical protein